jgi:hypothetical protein
MPRPSKPPHAPMPTMQEVANPMHPRDRRFYVIIAWSAVPAALIASCFIAWGGGQLPGDWAIAGIIVGLLGMCAATLYALDKEAPSPRYPGPIILGIAVVTWLLIGGQTWLFFHSPSQGYTQAQLDKAVEDGKAQALTKTSGLQTQLDTVTQQRDAALSEAATLRRQLEARAASPSATAPQQSSSQSRQQALSGEDIATKIGIWQSVYRQVNDLAAVLNKGYAMLDSWLRDVRSDRGNEIRNLETLAASVESFRARLDQLRNLYSNDAEVAEALKPVALPPGRPLPPFTIFHSLLDSISGFTAQLRSYSDPVPADIESEMIPFIGAFRRDLNAMRDWQSKVTQTAAEQDKLLSKMELK